MATFTGFGFLCFGGGYMLIALLMHFFVEEHAILTAEQFGNLLSISQITPGPVGINTATFVGYLNGGFFSSLGATIGLAIPSLTLGFIAVIYMRKYRENIYVSGALGAIKAAAAGSVIYASTVMLGVSVFSRQIPWREIFSGKLESDFSFSIAGAVITAAALILKLKTKLPAGAIIALGGCGGAILYWCKLW